MKEIHERLRELEQELREIQDLVAASSLLQWDQSVHMPPAGSAARARQIALLGRLAHERRTSRRMADLVGAVRALEGEATPDGALVRRARREHERASRIPGTLVTELESHLAESYMAWSSARPANDFATLQPLLERTLELSRRTSDCFPEREHVADPLIDESDPGMSAAQVSELFSELRERLVPIVRAIVEQPSATDSFLRQSYPKEEQLAFGREVVTQLGYDFERGRQDETLHPFMVRFNAGDVRITTRVKDDELTDSLFSTIHEAGHAMYEQNIRAEYDGTPLGHGVSAGVHESQSRLWENLVGRSRPFWDHFFPKLRERFPRQLDGVDVDGFYRGINKVERSLIRTEADEVTYNLHVMLRFDLEVRMLTGNLRVRDLPDAWSERFRHDLGIEPPDHKDGCLQDVHWFVQPIGGSFQGYTLGNLMSAQFMDAALEAHPDLPERLARGDFDTLRSWLTEHVYQHGAVYEPPDLVERATGKPLSVEPFIRYLRRKYGELYRLPES